MKTKSKLVSHSAGSKTFEVSEVIHAGTIEQYNRLIGYLFEAPHGVSWEHSATLRRSGSVFPKRSQALRALKIIHTKYKNGLTLKAI